MNSATKTIGTKQKALQINLTKDIYGSFAEIGAGQEVAANFFKAGGASGTIAKTISAYDMTFSDAIYGEEASGKYVCESRLMKMLNKEFKLLKVRLEEKSLNQRFFAFADTISALNFQKTNDAHGWIGLRFQTIPGGNFNDVVFHVNLLDNENVLQQQAIGILGVNLIHACFTFPDNPEKILLSLLDDLSTDRIEINMIRFEGADFKGVDNRLMALYLVKYGFTEAAVFDPDGNVMQPYDALSKKHIVTVRGRFRPITNVYTHMIKSGLEQFENEPDVDDNKIILLSELTLKNLYVGQEDEINEKDFLDRVDLLCSMGQTVLISNFIEYYKLVAFLSKFTKLKMALIMGMPNLSYIFEEEHYTHLKGGILDAFSKLFGGNIQLYLYPTLDTKGKLFKLEDFKPGTNHEGLFHFLTANNKLIEIKKYDESLLHIQTDKVLEMIKNNQKGWEELVPKIVAKQIKDNKLFGLK
jgi:hypothetical protein